MTAKFDAKELTSWVTDDVDGRFWLEDRVAEIISGSRVLPNTRIVTEEELSDAEEGSFEAGFDAGYEEGHEAGYEYGSEAGYEAGYDDGVADTEADAS